MPLTPEDVQNKRFRTVRGPFKEGYDEEEVDAFLDDVEAELRRLLADNETARTQAPAAAPTPAAAAAVVEEPNEAALRTLLLAQRTADDAIAQAKAEADQIVAQARVRASSIESEAQQQHAAAMAELQRQRGALENQIDEMRTFEREYRTRMKAYLEGQLRELGGGGVAPPAPGQSASLSPPARPAAGSPLPAAAPPSGGGSPEVPRIAPPTPTSATPPPAPAAAPPAAAPSPPQGPASPFAPAPRLIEDVDAGSDAPLGPPQEAGDEAESDEGRA
jgi:DivIVA domain-containing protein